MSKIKIKESELKQLVEGVIKKTMLEGVAVNSPKIEKYVNSINELISQAVDSVGDPIGVIDPTSTWEEPYVYEPIIYRNGTLKIVSSSVYDPNKKNVDTIKSRDMEYDGIPTLQLISRMYKKALKKKQNEKLGLNEDISNGGENVIEKYTQLFKEIQDAHNKWARTDDVSYSNYGILVYNKTNETYRDFLEEKNSINDEDELYYVKNLEEKIVEFIEDVKNTYKILIDLVEIPKNLRYF